MYQLSDEQVDYILNDISARGIKMEDLQDNLLDHVCCIIEQNLEDGGAFEAFYQSTIARFYKKDLAEIEEETQLLLTFKNYYAMRKVMIRAGVVSVCAFALGSLFKIMYWPGASVLFTLAIGIFSFIFMPLLFLLKRREASNTQERLLLASGVLAGIGYAVSTLFHVQHWPGARIMWFVTLILAFFVAIPLYFFGGIRKPGQRTNTIVISVVMVGVLGVQFLLTALRPSTQTTGRIYAYLQTEDMLEKLRHQQHNNDKLVQDIQATCEALKQELLQTEIGLREIPGDFEAQNIRLNERYVANGFFTMERPGQLLKQLKQQVAAYNASKAGMPDSQLPVKNSILDDHFLDKDFCSSLYVLNNIAQLQVFLAQIPPGDAATVR